FGLTIHSVIEGVALAASVYHRHDNLPLAGLGTFLVIFLHKPFDSMTIAMLMARGGWSPKARYAVNGLFALAIPVGIALFFLGMGAESSSGPLLAYSLAFSAGTFLCISLSDLLPELQFHDHDRGKLSVALLLGLALAWTISQFEAAGHQHPPAPPAPAETADRYEPRQEKMIEYTVVTTATPSKLSAKPSRAI